MEKSPKSPKIYECKLCNYSTSNIKDYNKHCRTSKHRYNEKSPNNPKKYGCDICQYSTSNLKDYNKHLSTAKHLAKSQPKENPQIILTAFENCPPDTTAKNDSDIVDEYSCDCGKYYTCRGSLWRHKKKCNPEESNRANSFEPKITTSMVIELLKQNNELQELLVNKLRKTKSQ